MKVLVTGASGFVGRGLCQYLKSKGHDVVRGVRKPQYAEPPHQDPYILLGEIDSQWQPRDVNFKNIEAVVHCAARVHVMKETARDPLEALRSVNRDGTIDLAKHAASEGVKHFVFISSIAVNGKITKYGQFFDETQTPQPC